MDLLVHWIIFQHLLVNLLELGYMASFYDIFLFQRKRSIVHRVVTEQLVFNQAWQCHRPLLVSSCCRYARNFGYSSKFECRLYLVDITVSIFPPSYGIILYFLSFSHLLKQRKLINTSVNLKYVNFKHYKLVAVSVYC